MKYSEICNRVSIDDNDRVYVGGVDVTEKRIKRIYSNGAKSKQYPLRRLVCILANGEPNTKTGRTIIHVDGDESNIRPSNLKWGKRDCSAPEWVYQKRKLTDDQIFEIVDMLNNLATHKDVAKKSNTTIAMVSAINRGVAYRDLTNIDPNKKFPISAAIKALPNGLYAMMESQPVQFFKTLEEAADALKQQYRINRTRH
ncbi:MAG: HNH endonuclease [Acinetobacter sp.]